MTTIMTATDIKKTLPQSHPFLFVDKITSLEKDKFIVGIKNVSMTDPCFQGHFPDHPILPGSLILESMCQTGSILILKNQTYTGRYTYFTSLNNIKFERSVYPGDQLRCEMEINKLNENEIIMKGLALVDGATVCSGEFIFNLALEPSKPQIHPTAYVHNTAILGHNVTIGANSIVGEHVHIGDNTIVEANCFLEKWTKIGEDCHLHFGAVIGSAAQDAKYKGEKSWVVIGDRNEIREYVTINRATGKNTITEIGSDNIFLTNVHIGHNCKLGSHIIIANMTNVAGHTEIEDRVVIGGMTGIHQFVKIGRGAMVGAYTRLPQDVLPFTLCEGNPALVRGLNLVGLRRQGFSKTNIAEIKEIFKLIYKSNLNTSMAIEAINKLTLTFESSQHMVAFLNKDSDRGFSKKTNDNTTTP